MSYILGCKIRGESELGHNAMVFKTREDAETYGQDLYSRWTMLESFVVEDSDLEPNYWYENGKLVRGQ